MKFLTIIFAVLLFSNVASASWESLINKVSTQGIFNPSDEEIPANYSLRDFKGGMDETHTANYINEWGYLDSETGIFNPAFVSMVSEQWDLSKDNIWTIDQWICLSTVEGELYKVTHARVVETMDNQVLDYKNEEIDSNLPVSTRKFAELIKRWDVK